MTDDDATPRFVALPLPPRSLPCYKLRRPGVAGNAGMMCERGIPAATLPRPRIGWITFVCRPPLPSSPHPLALPVMLGHAGRWLCPQGETAITVPIDGRHNARGLDSREFSTARQSIRPRRASGRAGWRGWEGGGDLPG